MAKAIYIGVGGVSRVAKAGYIGVNGVARKFTGDSYGVRQIILKKGTGTSSMAGYLYTDSEGNNRNIDNLSLPADTMVSIRPPSIVYVLGARQQHDLILDTNLTAISPSEFVTYAGEVECALYRF